MLIAIFVALNVGADPLPARKFTCTGWYAPDHTVKITGTYTIDGSTLTPTSDVFVEDEVRDLSVYVPANKIVLCPDGQALEIKAKTSCGLLARASLPGVELYVRHDREQRGGGAVKVVLPENDRGHRYAGTTTYAGCRFDEVAP